MSHGFTQRRLLKSQCVLLGVVETDQPCHYGHMVFFSYSDISQRKMNKYSNLANKLPLEAEEDI